MTAIVRVEGLEQVTRFVARAHDALAKAVSTREAKRVEDEGSALLHLAKRLKLSEAVLNRRPDGSTYHTHSVVVSVADLMAAITGALVVSWTASGQP